MRLVFTKPVLVRIAEIRDYIASDSSIERADKVISGLLDKVDVLLAHPLLGAPERHLRRRGRGIAA